MDLAGIGDAEAQANAMLRVARAADAEPTISSLWLYDHLETLPEPSQESTFECWITAAAIARETRRVQIGQMATCTQFRPPALLARMAASLDVLSGGRLIVGLGAGWNDAEAARYGIPFPDRRTRMSIFREACEVLTRIWTEDNAQFSGRHFSLSGVSDRPRPVQKPHPPLWIAGGGETVTLRLVARLGDGCNVGGGNAETVRHKLDILRRHCDEIGRPYEALTHSTSVEEVYCVDRPDQIGPARERLERQLPPALARVQIVDTPDGHARRLRALVDAGANYLLIYLRNVATEPEQLERLAREIIPRVLDR